MGRVKEGRGLFLGNAGEHYVVSELLRRDIIADLAPRNAPGIDVLATTGPQSVNIRVKTKSDDAESWVWMVSKANGHPFKRLRDERDFTVLVHYPKQGPPRSWIIPTHVLNTELHRVHEEWFKKPARSGKPKDPENPMRRFGWAPEHWEWLRPYEERWMLILEALGEKLAASPRDVGAPPKRIRI